MKFNNKISRRDFLKKICYLSGSSLIASFLPLSIVEKAYANLVSSIYVSKNGSPVTNMQKVIEMAGGITKFIDKNDMVVLKPNLQWPKQGYTHTEATKALIDIILNRPGGFTGEIIVAENVHFVNVDNTGLCGWSVGDGSPRNNNWPDMNYNELINYYNTNGYPNVTSAKMINETWDNISAPTDGQGYVPYDYTISDSPGSNGRICRLFYPIIQSAYSGKLIDTKNGVWSTGSYTGEQVKLIFLPTLNNHGADYSEDYAGATSAVKCHLGFVKMNVGLEGKYDLHRVGYSWNQPRPVGEAVGELITNVIQPTLYITVAEYTGWKGRTTEPAEHTKTIGLCTDPVALDYWMGKNVLSKCNGGEGVEFLDPSKDFNFRRTLEGCYAKGVGTLNEAEMSVELYDFNSPKTTRVDIERKIKQFKEGSATELDVKQLIEKYMIGI